LRTVPCALGPALWRSGTTIGKARCPVESQLLSGSGPSSEGGSSCPAGLGRRIGKIWMAPAPPFFRLITSCLLRWMTWMRGKSGPSGSGIGLSRKLREGLDATEEGLSGFAFPFRDWDLLVLRNQRFSRLRAEARSTLWVDASRLPECDG